MLFFGSSIFKIGRLLFIALLSVHLFACAFFRVKRETSSQEEIDNFYLLRNVDSAVRISVSRSVSGTCDVTGLSFLILMLVCRISQMLMYVLFFNLMYGILRDSNDTVGPSQLVCFYYVLTTFTTVGYGLYLSDSLFPYIGQIRLQDDSLR